MIGVVLQSTLSKVSGEEPLHNRILVYQVGGILWTPLGQETQACLARTFHETIVVGGLQSVLPSTTIPSVLPSTTMAKSRTCSSPGGVGIATLQSNGLLLVRPSTIPRNSDQDTKPEMPSR